MTSTESPPHSIGIKRIKDRLTKHKRWSGKDEGRKNHYPHTLIRLKENVWQHTLSCNKLSDEILNKYGLHSIRRYFVSVLLGVHEFGEWNGDITVEQQLLGINKPNELIVVKKLVEKFKLSPSYTRAFESFENWDTTRFLPFEAAFARFIDTYEGTRMYLENTFMSPEVSDEYKEGKIEAELAITKKRVLLPLLRLAKLYRGVNDEVEKTRFCFMVKNVVDHICLLFGPYGDRAREYFKGDTNAIIHEFLFRK